jgi:hypothetical protein
MFIGSSMVARQSFTSVTWCQRLREEGLRISSNRAQPKPIAVPSVLDYVWFQLLASPMAALLKDGIETDRQAAISSIASETATFSNPSMLDGGKSCFPQEAYVATAWSAD